jgi:predicted O-methyltransferase YrrM
VKSFLKRILPAGAVRGLLYLNRLRWVTKLRLLHHDGVRLRDDLGRNLRFVLWDPEVESFSYELDNTGELAGFVADLLGEPRERIAGYIAEVAADPELNEELTRRTRWRFDVKSPLPVGNRLLWYALTRATKPRLIVETGVYQGLGSLTLLRALDRNAAEGHDGELIGIDADPRAGVVVPERLAGRWRKVVGFTSDVLEREVAGREVDMLIQDTPHTYDNASFEYGVAVAHAGPLLVLIDSGGGVTPALRDSCAGRDARIGKFQERPRDHFYTPAGTQVAVVTAAPAS